RLLLRNMKIVYFHLFVAARLATAQVSPRRLRADPWTGSVEQVATDSPTDMPESDSAPVSSGEDEFDFGELLTSMSMKSSLSTSMSWYTAEHGKKGKRRGGKSNKNPELKCSSKSGKESCQPSSMPSSHPSDMPSSQPSNTPSSQPSETPSTSGMPSGQPSSQPSDSPSSQPSETPSTSGKPSSQPSEMPSTSGMPSSQPSSQPSSMPSSMPQQSLALQAKFVVSDGDVYDSFGISVAIHGETAIVGATGDDDNGSNSGSAYVFVRDATDNWDQQAKLVPNDGAADDRFGRSVSIHGDTAIVGADGNDDNGGGSGSAYAFVRNATGDWTEEAKLVASDGAAGDLFGYTVSIHGDTAIVSAYGDDDNGGGSGSAYAFVRNAT
ncbi:hypothetical protein ACHAXR_001643, partial [Thalassiosira sp. AJA248-18]